MTTNYVFPCASVNGLTLSQQRAAVAALKLAIKESVARARQEKQAAKAYKAAKVAERREAAIAKAQERLQKLLDKQNPVGSKAIKANRKASACTTTTFA